MTLNCTLRTRVFCYFFNLVKWFYSPIETGAFLLPLVKSVSSSEFSTVLCCLNIVFTIRSSNEWKRDNTRWLPCQLKLLRILAQGIFYRCWSSFTAIRIAWKILLPGCPPFLLAAAGILSRMISY